MHAGTEAPESEAPGTEAGGSEAPAVVLQHRDDAPGGVLVDVLTAAGFRPTTVRVDRGEPLPDPASIALAVTHGRDVAADGWDAGWVNSELEWLRQADKAGTAVLGVGLGAQALAIALGGGVERASRARHGWVWISSSIPGWISPGPWLAWQEDVIRLPPKARLLAHDPVGPQAYLTNGHLGIQFHPEITPKILGGWISAGCSSPVDTQGVLEVASREYRTTSAATQRLLSTYIRSVASRRP
jgi:GMP synthase-like glutamine amidotransferase